MAGPRCAQCPGTAGPADVNQEESCPRRSQMRKVFIFAGQSKLSPQLSQPGSGKQRALFPRELLCLSAGN